MGNQTTNRGSAALLADGSYVTQVGTTMSKWADGFAGAAYAAGTASITALTNETGNWDIVRTPTAMTVTLNNGSLAIGMGTTNGDQILLVGRHDVSIPQNLTVTGTISQRIAGNEIRFGMLEVDSAGVPVGHSSLTGFFRNMASILFNGTSATTGTAEVLEDNIGAIRTVAATIVGSGSASDYALELRPEDYTLTSQAADNAAARATGGARISTVVPNPNKLYRPFVWLRNVSAPASNTTVTLNRIISMDVQELQAEIGGGRGNTLGSQSIPVVLPAGTTISGTVTTQISNATVSNSDNGASYHKLISAATTNATLVKSGAGKIAGGSFANTSASWRYVKFYNKNTAPVAGTDTPVITLAVQPGARLDLGQVFDQYGLRFGTGLGYAITGAPADNDATAIGAGEVIVALLFA